MLDSLSDRGTSDRSTELLDRGLSDNGLLVNNGFRNINVDGCINVYFNVVRLRNRDLDRDGDRNLIRLRNRDWYLVWNINPHFILLRYGNLDRDRLLDNLFVGNRVGDGYFNNSLDDLLNRDGDLLVSRNLNLIRLRNRY